MHNVGDAFNEARAVGHRLQHSGNSGILARHYRLEAHTLVFNGIADVRRLQEGVKAVAQAHRLVVGN